MPLAKPIRWRCNLCGGMRTNESNDDEDDDDDHGTANDFIKLCANSYVSGCG